MTATLDPGSADDVGDLDHDGADGGTVEVVDPLANNQRHAPDRLDAPLDDIDQVNPDDTDDDPELSGDVELYAWPESPLRAPLERFAGRPLPTLGGIARSGRWWAVMLARAVLQIVLHLPQITWNQVPHTLRGVDMSARAYASYRGKRAWLEAAHAADAPVRALRVEKVETAKRGATRLTALALLLAFGGAGTLLLTGNTGWLVAAVVALVLILNLIGRREAPVHTGVDILSSGPFTEGAPSGMVVADVRAVLVERGHDKDRLQIGEVKVGEYGVTMVVQTAPTRPLDEEDVSSIERGLQTFRGAAHWIADPGNAARTELRLMWRDPLAESYAPLRFPPNSQSIATPAVVGYGLGGIPLELNLMRVNVVLVGGPGSGKSSSLWVLIDWLSTCRDVVLHGIDLSGGPMLAAWGDVFATRATNPDDAEALLRKRNASAIRRTNMLAERSEPRPGGPAPGSENWEPSDGKSHVVIIDELPLIANHPELVALLAEHQRIGRKAGETSISATQDLDGKTLGATSLRKYPSTVIMHACSREDVVTALGGGKVKEGWQPHRLTPAEGDTPNDAGKCYVKSGRHNRPIPWRFARLDQISEIHDRAIERMAAGRPTDDDEPVVMDEPGEVVPDIVADVLAVFAEHGGPEFLPTRDIVEGLNEGVEPGRQLSEQQLGAKLKAAGVTGRRRRVGGSASTRGYDRADVERGTEQGGG